nr:protein Dok-7 [Loxodonta africana]
MDAVARGPDLSLCCGLWESGPQCPDPCLSAADCLLMLAYKDRAERAKGLRERSSLTLEDICGLEPGLPYEGLAHTLAIICRSQAIMLGFESREAMCAWDARIRYALGEVHRFHVTVAPGTKLQSGPATLHLCNDVLVVARDVPPAVTGQWKLSDLRRYGAVPNGFIFEGGTRCGYWAGVFFLSSAEGEQISFLFDCIVRGISPTKGPFGLRPLLPARVGGSGRGARNFLGDSQHISEPMVTWPALPPSTRVTAVGSWLLAQGGALLSPDPASVEVRLPSFGGRLLPEGLRTVPDPVVGRGEHHVWVMAADPPSQGSGHPLSTWGDETCGHAAGGWVPPTEPSVGSQLHLGTSRPPPKPLRPRQLQEVGRQGSSDSGIATGSHSSYSGSFSSYAGSSLDVWPATDDFGSLLSLPPTVGAPELGLCTCPAGTAPRAAEYQVPGAPRPHYDTPRSLRQVPRDQSPASQSNPDDGTAAAAVTTVAVGDSGSQMSTGCPSSWLGTERRGLVTEALPPSPAPGEPWEAAGPHAGPSPACFSACPVCGGVKVRPPP